MKIQTRSRAPLVKIGASRQVAIPKKIYDEMGFVPGDYLAVERRGHGVMLTPKAFIERRLAEGLEDIRRGRGLGPFDTAKEAIRALRAAVHKK